MLRVGAGAPLRALLTASLPPRLAEEVATDRLAAMLARLAASLRCAAALQSFWPELCAMCAEVAVSDVAARRRGGALLLALRRALLGSTAPPAATPSHRAPHGGR